MRRASPIVYFFLCFALGYSCLNFFQFEARAQTSSQAIAKEYPIHSVLKVSINSSINPGTYNYLKSAYDYASKNNFQALLVALNTPGGLVSTTKDLLTLMGTSSLPTIFWVTPEGASATSAGAIWASGSHLLYMSKGTNIGAATPIEMSGEIKEKDARNKAINDLVALVKGLSLARDRNPEAFGKMIEDAKSYNDKEALQLKVVNGVVSSASELIEKVNGTVIEVKGEKLKLKMQNPRIVEHAMETGQKLLDFFSDPALAYILFLIGAALVYVEMQAPGGFLAGSVGALCLILAGIAFQVLPLNYGALGLLALSFILFVLEAFITSYGILTLAGIISLTLGSLFLYHTDDSYLSLSKQVMVGSIGSVVAFLVFIVFFLVKDLRKKKIKTFNAIVGEKAKVTGFLDDQQKNLYHVRLHGELWKAKTEDGGQLSLGDNVSVEAMDQASMTLLIKKLN